METRDGTKLVLLIEDDANERRIYGDLLWYNGFDVMDASTAEQGYWLAREGQPDLIVLDLMLPDMNGLALCERLKAERATASIPVLALSARPERPFAGLAAHAGCAAYLEKPRPPLELLGEVVRMIGRSRARAPLPGRRRTE